MKKLSEVKRGQFILSSGSLSLVEKQLKPDETPLIVVQGWFDDKGGVLAATDQRVIFAGKLLFTSIIKDVPYSKLSSVLYESGLVHSKVKLEFSGGKMEVKQIEKKYGKELVDIVKAQLDKKEETPSTSVGNSASMVADGLYEKLNKLAELKERGILTDEEFVAEKKKLLEGN